MSDFLTVKYLTTNLEVILSTTLNWKLEDGSSERTPETNFLCQLLFTGIEYEETYGQRPSYAEANFDIKVKTVKKTPSNSRDGEQEIITSLRDAITIDLLNVNNLAVSKLVSRVTHRTPLVSEHENNMSEITYRVSLRYREE